jgi:4-alpha-glucanotransferase
VIVGEDLGTVPDGFRQRSAQAGLAGMRVLWFERGQDGAYLAPQGWDVGAVALATTHDLPTVAGWWRGRDIEWREDLALDLAPSLAHAERDADKTAMWAALCQSGSASGSRPGSDEADRVVAAALGHVGASSCGLALASLEDVAAELEQPNLPGTTSGHPNWRRRLAFRNGLDDEGALGRLAGLAAARDAEP